MEQSSRYETLLGRLGAYLACQEARRIEIADEGQFVTVSWQSQGPARRHNCFREDEIARLQPNGRNPYESSSRAALLGVLGRKLDESGMDVARIEEKTEVFLVSGATSGRYSNLRVGYWELRGQPAPRLDSPEDEASADSRVDAEQDPASAVPTPLVREPLFPTEGTPAEPPTPAAILAFEPARESSRDDGPATEILSRELRPVIPTTHSSPLLRRLRA